MADRTRPKGGTQRNRPPVRKRATEGDDAERALGRGVAVGLPLVGVAAAVVVGIRASIGPALLVLAAVALLGTISLLWASVRTLSGDAPLPVNLEATGVKRAGADSLREEKRRVLRALKDLEAEHAVGKIDDADYEAVVARYRQEAKSVMRQMDMEVSPFRAEAERIAQEFLSARGLTAAPTAPSEANSQRANDQGATSPGGRIGCAGCGTSNETDAAFCKHCGAAIEKAVAGDAIR